MKVFVLGSCVSRDVFSVDNQDEFRVVEYVARSSLGSMFSRQPFEDIFSARLESKFQKRLVGLDICKGTVARIRECDFDLIIIDLIDERFDLVETAPGAVCTDSAEFRATCALKEILNLKILKSGTEEFFEYWHRGWTALVSLLGEIEALEKIRINKVYWQPVTDSSSVSEACLKANSVLERMYERISQDIPIAQILSYDESTMRCSENHRWGRAPFHFVDDFCRAAIAQLKRRAN